MTDNPNLTPDQAAEYLRLSERTLIRWRNRRVGPAWVKVGRRVLYRRSDLDSWMDNQRVVPVREVTQ